MYLIFLKLTETLARALFVFTAVYSLSIEQAGQFGILVTLVGIFAFLFGYERHIDIQRKYAGEKHSIFDSAIIDAMFFYGFNYLLVIPFFFFFVVLWAQFEPILAIACIGIVVGEHIANQAYQLALVNERYRNLIIYVVIKNIITFGVTVYLVFFTESILQLTDVLKIWSIASVLCAAVLLIQWWFFKQSKKKIIIKDLKKMVFIQHKQSFVHFLIGLVAILTLQLDRLMAGSLLELSEVGVYFRHILLISFIYQFFNIASFNRVLPKVFSQAKQNTALSLKKIIRKEGVKVLLLASAIYLFFLAIYFSPLGDFFERYQVKIELLGLLLITFTIRATADLNGLVFNAKGKEKKLLTYQLTTLSIGSIAFVLLTLSYGILGTIIAGSIGAITYFLLTNYNYRFIDSGI